MRRQDVCSNLLLRLFFRNVSGGREGYPPSPSLRAKQCIWGVPYKEAFSRRQDVCSNFLVWRFFMHGSGEREGHLSPSLRGKQCIWGVPYEEGFSRRQDVCSKFLVRLFFRNGSGEGGLSPPPSSSAGNNVLGLIPVLVCLPFRNPKVSHKTCRFYFILERTNTTLGDYLRLCLESDQVAGSEIVRRCREVAPIIGHLRGESVAASPL